MNDQIEKLKRLNGELCAEINALTRAHNEDVERINELESLACSLFGTMNTLRINGHAPTGRQLDHFEQRMAALGLEAR